MTESRQEVGSGHPDHSAGALSSRSATRKEVFAWAMYDWANSAFSTLSITVLVSYIKEDVFPGDAGTLLWGWGIGISMLFAAVLSPILGAIADAHASKRRWLAVTALPGALAASLLFFTTPQTPYLVAFLFLTATLCFELALGFYNGFLPEIADDENMGRISAWGYALGYLGGGLALAIVIGIFFLGDQLGLPSEGAFRKRLALLLTGLWWGLFTLPTLLILRDKHKPSREPQPLMLAARQAFREVGQTIRNVRRFHVLALFLLGFLIYNDGVQTMISQASVFAIEVLAMEAGELAMVVLMIQFIALPGAMLVGFLADRFGQKITLLCCLLVWIVLLVLAFFITTKAQFWWMAAVAALVLGGTQSVSRAVMGLMTPKKHTAEFFGFFNLSGKATSMFGPVFFASILAFTGSAHLAILSLLIFFVVGLLIVLPLNIARGQQQARTA